MRTVLALMFLFILIQSCNNKSNVTERLLILSDSNTIASINRINFSNAEYINWIQQKTFEPGTTYKATIWLNKAQQVQTVINNFISSIQVFQKRGFKNNNKLVSEIKVIKDSLLNVDPLITEYFKPEIKAFPKSYDSFDEQSEEFMHSHLSELSPTQFNLFFSQLKLQSRILENNLVKFCAEQIPHGAIIDDFYSAIITQNYSILPPGKELEISAGVGSFTRSGNAIIIIRGKKIDIGEYGITIYKMIVPKKEGKYSLPIKIQYLDQDGKQQTIEKNVEYQVKNCQ